MIRLILLKFWPALIPVVIFFIWWFIKKRRQKQDSQDKTSHIDLEERKPMSKEVYYLILSTLIMIVLCFLYMMVTINSTSKTYVPTQIIDGKIVPGYEKKP